MAIQTNRPNNRTILVVGIILAVLAAAGALVLLKNTGSNAPTVKAVVAKVPIPGGTAITADQLTTTDLPVDTTPTDVFQDPNQVVGKQLVNPVNANVAIFPALLSSPTSTAGGATGLPQITPGFVALAIPAAGTPLAPAGGAQVQMTGVGGELLSVGYYISAGDHIDILVDNGQGVRYSFQDVRILRAGAAAAAAGGAVTFYIIELPRDQAEVMTYIVTHTPTATSSLTGYPTIIKYVLRPQSEWGIIGNTDPKKPTYPNYESTKPAPTGPGSITDSTVTSGTLQGLFGK